MVTRVITSIITLPLLIIFISLGGIYLKIGLIGLCIIGMGEVYIAISKKHMPIHYVGYFFCIIYILFMDSTINKTFYVLISLFILCLLVFLVFNHTKINVMDCAVTLFGFYYVAFLLSSIYFVREYTHQDDHIGIFFVWLIFICAWCCDTGAYFVGSLIGKHKLTPLLSPKKTIEGAIGGVVFAGLGTFIYSIIVSRMYTIDNINIIIFSVIIGVVGALFAQLGDLSASAIKRYTNIKDYGKIFPGHGGVVDRFDSVIFTAPIVYIVMRILFLILG